MSEATSARLNYLSKKQRAVSSRASRQIISASNGRTFSCGSVSRIDLAGNQMATYLDFSNSVVKFTVKNLNAASIKLESAYALIDRLEILSDGSTISSIANYGACVHQFLTTEVGADWKTRFGRGLVGTSAFNVGADTLVKTGYVDIAKDATRSFALPLVLCPLFMTDKYIPMMGRSTISIRITWASSVKGTIGAATNEEVVISPVDFIGQYIRLSADANQMVLANTNNRFELICSDIRTAEGSHNSTTDTVISQNCGFSFSSLDRVSFSFYPTLNSAGVASVGNQGSAGISEYSLAINGEEHPRKRIPVSATDVSEAYAEVGKAHRSLTDFGHNSGMEYARYYLVAPTGATGTLTGCFVAMIDTESMSPHGGDTLYSGLSTLGSVVQLVGNAGVDAAGGVNTLLVFAQYTLSLVLDLNGSGTWITSI
jgi:hypothetical protein